MFFCYQGDHCYKCNTDLPADEQMISAFPDIQTAELTKENDFMVIACDGIWYVYFIEIPVPSGDAK